MNRPRVDSRFINADKATLPYSLTAREVADAIQSVYDYWYKVNEWHIDEGYGRFHEQFRANNAIGGFVSDRITRALVDPNDGLELNPSDDGYPDIHYTRGSRTWPDDFPDKAKDEAVPGVEVKASRDGTITAHHNVEGWVMGIHYNINARGRTPDDVPPISILSVRIASMNEDDWEEQPSGEDSNRTNTTTLPTEALHELRKNPVYQTRDGIPQSRDGDWNTLYKRIHALFDDEFRNDNPDLFPAADGSNLCSDCGRFFKNDRGVSSHQSRGECGES
ncbi:hypothetical protein ABSL23_01425 [Halobacterium sp. NMX12-1]|uniref:C2H2-type domain-containing protein n=1 Tax=Halobacterium sp. NMX12-1 TaxID=3166650 RepID=A0AAU8CC54_9EURY